MELSRVIVGPVVTEKAERQKTAGIYTMIVRAEASKVDVKNALRKFFDADAVSVRVLRTRPKWRDLGAGRTMEKRHREKRVIVRLKKGSKPLDLATFKTA
jgi:ribosomal protein L23